MPEVQSTCCYCGVGCGVLISRKDGKITGVRGDPAHPANFGKLCGKGQTLQVTEGINGAPECKGAVVVSVSSELELLEVMRAGDANRAVANDPAVASAAEHAAASSAGDPDRPVARDSAATAKPAVAAAVEVPRYHRIDLVCNGVR